MKTGDGGTGNSGNGSTGGGGGSSKVLNLLPGGGMTNEEKEAIARFTANVPYYIEAVQGRAKLLSAKYKALIDEGFSEQQALLICIQTPLF